MEVIKIPFCFTKEGITLNKDMKATIEFNLPEESNEHLRTVQSGYAWSALHDIDYMLRNLLKHGDDRYKTVEELAHAIREEARYAINKIEE